MATTTDTDLTAADVAWDLEPLVDHLQGVQQRRQRDA